jgi:Ca2+-binding RTX toxin-like protein
MLFIQRDPGTTTGTVTFTGDRARILLNGHVIVDWTTGGTLTGVPQGDGYTLQTQTAGVTTPQKLAIGVIVAALGQSNMAKWFYGGNAVDLPQHGYMSRDGSIGYVSGGPAREFVSDLSQALGAPVLIVNTAVGGTALTPAADAGNGYWLDQEPGSLYANAVAAIDKVGGKAEFVLWAQGETDATLKVAPDLYAAELTELFGRIEQDFGDAPQIFISSLGNAGAPSVQPYYDQIRAAQVRVADDLDYVQIGATTTDLQLYQTIHLTEPSGVTAAERMATAIAESIGIDVGRTIRNGTAANDRLVAAGSSPVEFYGRGGDDTLEGGSLNDLLFGGQGNDVLIGNAGHDILRGDSGDDYLDGSDGQDVLEGAAGADQLFGGGGNDDLWGNGGNDTLWGGTGNDVLVGGTGVNILVGGAGADIVDGTEGVDTVSYASSGAGVNVSLATGSASGGDAEGDALTEIENLTGSGFDDVLEGDGGPNMLDGGTGSDTLSYANTEAGVIVSLATSASQDTGGAGLDRIAGFENLTGSTFADVLTGNLLANTIAGGRGDDWLFGAGGFDTLLGQEGNDYLDGGSGAANTLIGGVGDDTYIVHRTGEVIEENADEGTDTVVSEVSYALGDNLENLQLSGSVIRGVGNGLDNNITGNSQNNVLSGGAGTDLIYGGDGQDAMTGGAGADTFAFGAVTESLVGATHDRITDFEDGIDKIDLSAIGGASPFHLAHGDGSGFFTGSTTELRFVQNAATMTIFADLDGNKVADFQLQLSGTHDLAYTDFLL